MLTLGTGGSARFFIQALNEAELVAALAWAEERSLQAMCLGGGSNLVVSDAGFDGLVIQLANRGVGVVEDSAESVLVEASAGEVWDDLVSLCVCENWSGLECLSGIPGRVGATPIQNVGAYGQEVSQTIERVRCLDRTSRDVREFSNADCHFGYRDSRFKRVDRNRYVVTAVQFRLRKSIAPLPSHPELAAKLPSSGASLEQIRQAVLTTRRSKSMVWDPADPNRRSCGSFFVNPVLDSAEFLQLKARCDALPPHYPQAGSRFKVPAAWLIEQAGFGRGHRIGNVGLSTNHTLCLVAHDGARTDELVHFAQTIQRGVLARFGVRLTPEPVLVGVHLDPPA